MSGNNRRFLLGGIVVTLLVAVVVTQFSSSDPDGLEYVAEQEGFADTAEEHDLTEGPLADYTTDVTSNSRANTAIAAVAGVGLTLIIGYGVFWLARRSNRSRPESTTR
ncbi:MAG: PDGLE domain-containing protein [Acidimicrobiia bacterium]|nr:PDGLE domain-containing protein [Acidimicrobiia bacterium]